MRLKGSLEPVADLSPHMREEMFRLMDRHYANLDRANFERDLDGKRWAILLRDPGEGTLRGFSTQTCLSVDVRGETARILYSGDTIVDPDHWGDQSLARLWGRLALALIAAHEGESLWWFLLSKGYKTYRFLPVFFHEFYPRFDRGTPDFVGDVVDAVAGGLFPHAYDRAARLVRADATKEFLRPGVADLSADRLRDPHVAYFSRCNPQHARGDELCCLAPLTLENFRASALRVIGRAPDLPSLAR